jgi:Arc/MetJ family transcription regulator
MRFLDPADDRAVYQTLINMYCVCILMHMRTTLIIDEDLLQRARELTGIKEKTALIHAGLEALIAREAAKRLASLGGTEPKLREIPRRRPA